VPLNYEIETENLNFILDKTKGTILVLTKKIQEKLKFRPVIHCIHETDLLDIVVKQQVKTFPIENNKQEVAEIIFTSGSTGTPKGVVLSHANIIANTNSILEYLKLTSEDRILVVLPFFYCYGLSLLHTHLKVGGSIVLNNSFVFLGTVFDDLKKYQCTGFAGVPSHFQILLKKSQSFKKTQFPDLRYVTQAGGKLHDVFINEFVETFPAIDFFVMYGQTEATARLSYLPPHLVKEKMGSIGKAIPGVTLKVLKKDGSIAKVNKKGELVAQGDNIMLGYFNELKETNAILKNGWLYTGDIAKVDADGFIYLVARKKEIIKVAGKRVSLKEIEKVIVSVPEVIDCTVIGIYDALLGEAIQATVVVAPGCDSAILKEEILLKCKQNLSPFKVPQRIEVADRMVLKSTGKK